MSAISSLSSTIDAKGHSAHGVVTHTLAPLRDGLASLVLDAGDNLKILGCKIDGSEAKFSQAVGKTDDPAQRRARAR